MIYKTLHLKSGKIYTVIDDNVIDCTNGNDDRRSVLYTNGDKKFIREYNEFMEKFVKLP